LADQILVVEEGQIQEKPWREELIEPKLRISIICSSSRQKRSFVWFNPDKKSFCKGFFRQFSNGNFPLLNSG
jgi:hypothetical protein